MTKLDGKIAIVTGGGSGIGRAISLAFAAEGANIVVDDINLEGANSVVNEVEALGREALAVKADVSNIEEVNQMVEAALDKFGKIDILVNNACRGAGGRTEELAEERWDRCLNVCLKGALLCSQAAGKVMIKQGKGGRIINISSMLGLKAGPNSIAYVSAKSGLIGFTQSLAIDWAKYNINVNCIAPGLIETPMILGGRKEGREERATLVPLGRLGVPEDVAKVALFLASSESDYVTGITMPVDGGMYAVHSGYVLRLKYPGVYPLSKT